MTTEEARAVEFRRSQLARKRNDEAADRRLKGDAAARKALRDAWEPLVLALRESREPDSEC